MKCPKCGGECDRDMVDVGVCSIPSGPMGCPDCHWVEETPELLLDDPRIPHGSTTRGDDMDRVFGGAPNPWTFDEDNRTIHNDEE
jgi:hypothetical protein